MTRLAAILLAVAAAAGAVACGGDDATDGAGTTPPGGAGTTSSGGDETTASGGALVVYERAGGIAFTAQRMVIEQDGSATVDVEGPGGVGADFDLADAELEKLRALLAAATLESQAEPSGCADCYVYRIDHAGDSATFDQVSYPPGAEPLVAFLSEIVERETQSGPARGGS